MNTSKYYGWNLVERRNGERNPPEIDALKAKVAEYETVSKEILNRMMEERNHLLHCNANHEQPVGGDMCICVPTVRKRALNAEAKVAELAAELKKAAEQEPVGIAILAHKLPIAGIINNKIEIVAMSENVEALWMGKIPAVGTKLYTRPVPADVAIDEAMKCKP